MINDLMEIKNNFLKHDLEIIDFAHDLLANLFRVAVQKLDYYENVLFLDDSFSDQTDERDFKDMLCDQEFIVCDLLDELDGVK